MCIFVYRAAVVFPSASARPDLQKRIHSARLLKHYHQSYFAFRFEAPGVAATARRPRQEDRQRPRPTGHALARQRLSLISKRQPHGHRLLGLVV